MSGLRVTYIHISLSLSLALSPSLPLSLSLTFCICMVTPPQDPPRHSLHRILSYTYSGDCVNNTENCCELELSLLILLCYRIIIRHQKRRLKNGPFFKTHSILCASRCCLFKTKSTLVIPVHKQSLPLITVSVSTD